MKAKTIVFAILIVVLLFGSLVVLPVFDPALGAEGADIARSIVGPGPVGFVEGISADIQDRIFKAVASAPAISVVQETKVKLPPVLAPGIPRNVVTADPQIGWQPYGPLVNGEPVMAQALVTPDPTRAYAAIVLVRIDLTKVELHMEPGVSEPSHSTQVQAALPNRGSIPPEDLGHLIAAFNGGFKAINGSYGMMTGGVTLLPPKQGLETIVQYKDMSLDILNWGVEVPRETVVSFRQNCPPLVDNGQIPSDVNIENSSLWGFTVGNKVITWRTALGITKDRRYLIYAVANASTVATLAQTMKEAGAENAMQLDINKYYVHFVTFQTVNGHLAAVRLLNTMADDPTSFLTPRSRDFFYLTLR